MGQSYAQTMFGEAAKRLQERHGSRASYARLAERGPSQDALGEIEQAFVAARDSFYLASVTEDGWPYVQHRGGPVGFLRVLDGRTLAFADLAGNKQYITAGNLVKNDRVALFLMSYPEQARLKLIGHASFLEPGTPEFAELLPKVRSAEERTVVERIMLLRLTAFDWNCSQYITPRWTEDEIARSITPVSKLAR